MVKMAFRAIPKSGNDFKADTNTFKMKPSSFAESILAFDHALGVFQFFISFADAVFPEGRL
jgi:hypothetical protein